MPDIFSSKATVSGEHVLGIERYVPGDPSTKMMAVKTTSGTSGRGVSVFIANLNTTAARFPYHPTLESPYLSIGMPPSNACLETNRLLYISPVQEILSLGPAEITLPSLGELMRQYRPKSLNVTPVTNLRTFMTTLENQSALDALSDVRTLCIAGEILSVQDQQRIRTYFPKLERLIDEYGTAETNNMALGCEALALRYADLDHSVFHPIPDVHLWIKDPDTDGVGEIVVSTLDLPNFLTGDAGMLANEPCSCGATQTLHLFGRLNFDRFHCAGGFFHVASVESVLASSRAYIQDYRLEVSETGTGNTMRGKALLRIVPTERMKEIKNPTLLFGRLLTHNLLLTRKRTLGDFIYMNAFEPLEVRIEQTPFVEQKKIRLRKVPWTA